jgi:hypothetical protein
MTDVFESKPAGVLFSVTMRRSSLSKRIRIFARLRSADRRSWLYLGLTPKTVSQLERRRLIALPSRRDITIPGIDLLAAAAQIETCSDAFDEGQSRAVA